jgi:phosphoribosyl-AMP cyclohydrolase / phosphoribosyl-ATP pyrophosphohydrolase
MEPDWAKQPLLPVVVQDARSLDVLTLAYVNPEALEATLRTGEMHFWSRSRGRLWRKGEESGHVQRLRALALDCDGDAFLAQVEPAGPACHTGEATCFHHPQHGQLGAGAFAALWVAIEARKGGAPEGSYTAKLLADENLRLKKLAEEAGEVIMACKDKDKAKATAEFADLQYHMLVAMAAMGIGPGDVAAELARRAGATRR